MGWLLFLGLVIAAGLLLWLRRFPRRLWAIPATAVMLGAAGYAWQGAPGLAGHSVKAAKQQGSIDPELIALREVFFGRFNFDAAYFMASDAMERSGSSQAAAKVMIGAVRKAPENAGLWTWAGVVLAQNDGNQISPASRFAFDRAMTLAPKHPGPPFFYGLAHIREGKLVEARPYWAKAVALTPKDASYRGELLTRLFLLDRFLEAQQGGSAPQR
ncbi:tetratricopeptide repeat protein [Sphingomonas xinjiangensis]|uniref:Flp pilus assembly protein TadD n=1 Tax=Sphingomonas xinjiangensis TaxID=643568 RepID=A0A840YJ65_9SPHN|nr:cytochrome c biogenesis factor-like protein [Sphingomonas xinjiangensis]MBB5708836.1 Flp pilus assembly protein TadD [Sphingomonas xinjiangensis]